MEHSCRSQFIDPKGGLLTEGWKVRHNSRSAGWLLFGPDQEGEVRGKAPFST